MKQISTSGMTESIWRSAFVFRASPVRGAIVRYPARPGDTLRSESEVIGLKQNSNGKTGVLYVRTRGLNQHDEVVMEYVRWVMVRKRGDGPAPQPGASG